jgi:hypothetical protein
MRKMGLGSWGGTIGLVVAIVLLAVQAVALLHSDGANYKVLVAVWLWALPFAGFFSGIGYGVGKLAERLVGTNATDGEGGAHADAR